MPDPKITDLFSSGPVRFDRFMGAALYHPQEGYYTRHIRTVGRRGDFSTSPAIHTLLGKGVAKWIKSLPPLPIIEVGAGTGALAKSVLSHLGVWRRLRSRYHIVDVSSPLRTQQEQTLRGQKVTWHSDMRFALAACGGKAHIFSNELVDAFPCRVFVKAESTWQELAIQPDADMLTETLIPSEIPRHFPEEILTTPFPKGQRIEIQESYREWLHSWMEEWQCGNMLTIDYGGIFPQLYHRRPRGTLRAYFHHQHFEGAEVYRRIGKQDITADVNFSLLSQWGESLGLRTVTLEAQRAFLLRFLGERQKHTNAAAAFLFQEPGPGDAFCVLEQQRR